jgi:hypothetical protein
MQLHWDSIVVAGVRGRIDHMSNWWLLPVVTITSIWIGAGLGIVVATLCAAANGRRP